MAIAWLVKSVEKNICKISPPCFFFLCKNSVFEILKPNIWHINSELTHSEINTLPQIFETSLDIVLIARVFTELLSQKWGLSEVIKNKKKVIEHFLVKAHHA